jgi:hypothetical protein
VSSGIAFARFRHPPRRYACARRPASKLRKGSTLDFRSALGERFPGGAAEKAKRCF